MDRNQFNKYEGPKITKNTALQESDRRLMKSEEMKFDAQHRRIVEEAIRDFCDHRRVMLHALNVRTNHAHIVVAAGKPAERMMGSIKSYATRALRGQGLVDQNAKVWSRHGSTKYLWSEDHIFQACDYVNNGQGRDLPPWDSH